MNTKQKRLKEKVEFARGKKWSLAEKIKQAEIDLAAMRKELQTFEEVEIKTKKELEQA